MLFLTERGKLNFFSFMVNHFLGEGCDSIFYGAVEFRLYTNPKVVFVQRDFYGSRVSGKSDGNLRCSCLRLCNVLSPQKMVENAFIYFASEDTDFRRGSEKNIVAEEETC